MEKHAADLAAMGAISNLSLNHVVDDHKANRENDDLDKRYGAGGSEYEDVMPVVPPISTAKYNVASPLPDAGAGAGGWRASVAMYRAERDARVRSGSSGRPGDQGSLPRAPAAPAVPQVGGGSDAKTTRPAVLQGTAGLTQAERRRRIEENLASVDPSQLQYVTAHGTLC